MHLISIALSTFTPRHILTGVLALASLTAQAADIHIQPAAGSALLVRDSAGSAEHLRIEEDGSGIALGAGTNKLLMDINGNVLAGAGPISNSPYRFQIDGITGSFHANGLRIQNTAANTGWSLYSASAGDLLIGRASNLGQFDGTTGAYASLSDERAKTAIRPLEGVLGKVMQLQTSRYRYKAAEAGEGNAIGLTAQNLQQYFPEFVRTNTTNEGNPTAPQQMFVDYAGLSVVALRALQEQQQAIATLQAQVQALTARLAAPQR